MANGSIDEHKSVANLALIVIANDKINRAASVRLDSTRDVAAAPVEFVVMRLVWCDMVKLIYIGDHFYGESGSMMSPIYTEDDKRYDWGVMQVALLNGEEISIRQATQAEKDKYEAQLSRLKRERGKVSA